MKLVLTGGHLTPALGFIDYILEKHPTDELIFVGREYSQEKNKQPSKERSEIEKRSVKFIAFKSGKFTDRNPLILLSSLALTIKAFFHALTILLKEKPNMIVTFGSYLAVPVAFAGWLLGIPIITHEQTRTVGIANTWIAMVAKALAVSYPQEPHQPVQKKAVFTGNIIRTQLIQKSPQTPEWILHKPNKPILYITGGSQGSEIINTVIGQSLSTLLKDWYVIHQCGSDSAARSYKQELEHLRDQLKPQQRFSYIVREWVSIEELAWIYQKATATISRAGANTTQEIALFTIPAIMVPLPFSHKQEQQLNAEWLANTGGALIVAQKDLTTDTIIEALEKIKAHPSAFRRKLAELQIPTDAAERLYDLVLQYQR